MEIGYLEEVKAIIKSLVLSSTSYVNIDKLMKDYKEIEGRCVPYKRLGFQNAESFLRSIPDTVRVVGSGDSATVQFVSNQKSEHIHQMISKQKKPKRSRAARSQRSYQQLNQPAFCSTFELKEQRRPSNPPRNITTTSSNTRYSGSYKPIKHTTPRERDQYTPKSHVQAPRYSIDNKKSYTDFNNHDQFVTGAQTKHGKTNEIHLQKHASCHHRHQPVSLTTTKPVQAEIKCDENLKKQSPMARAKPESSEREPRTQTSPTEKCTVDTLSSTMSDPNTYVVSKILGGIVKQSKNDCLHSIVPKPENVYADKIKMLSKNFNKSLNIVKLNQTLPTVAEICTPNGIDKSYLTKLGNSKISELFSTSGSSEDRLKDLDEAVPEFAINSLVFRMDFPENTVLFGQKIAPYTLPADIKQGSIIGIFISEVHNPFKFWFQIYKENHELDSLMFQIERFYKPLVPEDLRIPRICITPGQICAALYHGMWHRAEIVSPIINSKAKVLFVDYGTVTEVNVDDIKYLATMFAHIPTQAIRGCLSKIKPFGLHWSLEATNHFLSMVSELMLYAQVSEIDETNRAYYMVICDTNGNEVTQINKALVDKGFGIYNDSWHESKIQKMGQRCRHPRENFPTFTMIEIGEYPSFAELVNLQVGGIDYEGITDGILFHPGQLNKNENAPEAIRKLPFKLFNTNPFRFEIVMMNYMNQIDSNHSDNRNLLNN